MELKVLCVWPARCQQLPCREATAAEVAACHRPDLFARLEAASARAEALSRADLEDEEDSDAFRDTCVYFTPDTYANPNTGRCARLAAGASIDVAVSVATCVPRSLPAGKLSLRQTFKCLLVAALGRIGSQAYSWCKLFNFGSKADICCRNFQLFLQIWPGKLMHAIVIHQQID